MILHLDFCRLRGSAALGSATARLRLRRWGAAAVQYEAAIEGAGGGDAAGGAGDVEVRRYSGCAGGGVARGSGSAANAWGTAVAWGEDSGSTDEGWEAGSSGEGEEPGQPQQEDRQQHSEEGAKEEEAKEEGPKEGAGVTGEAPPSPRALLEALAGGEEVMVDLALFDDSGRLLVGRCAVRSRGSEGDQGGCPVALHWPGCTARGFLWSLQPPSLRALPVNSRAGVEMWQKEGTALLPAGGGGPGGGGDMVAVHRQLYLMHFLVDGLGACCLPCHLGALHWAWGPFAGGSSSRGAALITGCAQGGLQGASGRGAPTPRAPAPRRLPPPTRLSPRRWGALGHVPHARPRARGTGRQPHHAAAVVARTRGACAAAEWREPLGPGRTRPGPLSEPYTLYSNESFLWRNMGLAQTAHRGRAGHGLKKAALGRSGACRGLQGE
jgi:hypothetical protein